MDEVLLLQPCASCGESVMHRTAGPLQGSLVFCGDVCVLLARLLSSCEWHDATELTPGGRFYDRPELWRG